MNEQVGSMSSCVGVLDVPEKSFVLPMPSWQDVQTQASLLVLDESSLPLVVRYENYLILTKTGKEVVKRYYDGPITPTMEDAFAEAFSDFSAGLLIDLVSRGELPPIMLALASLYTLEVYNYYHGTGGWMIR
jgi:hypothetical protein